MFSASGTVEEFRDRQNTALGLKQLFTTQLSAWLGEVAVPRDSREGPITGRTGVPEGYLEEHPNLALASE